MTGNWLFWSLFSALFAGITAILAKIGLAGISTSLATAIRTSVVLLLVCAVAFFQRDGFSFREVTPRTWLFLVLSGAATGLSWLCYFRALQLGPASRVAPVDKLSVIVVIALGALVLHEPLGWKQWAGGLLVLAGSALVAL